MCVSRMQRTLVSGRLVASSPIRGVGLCLSGHDVVADATYRTSYSAMSRQGQLAGHAMQRDAMRSLRIARAQAGSALECVPSVGAIDFDTGCHPFCNATAQPSMPLTNDIATTSLIRRPWLRVWNGGYGYPIYMN